MKVKILILSVLLFVLSSCTSIPEGITPVTEFNADRYLGKWYEIARLDHSFERGLSSVTATYSLREDGGIDVLNKGYNKKSGEWEEAQGKAYFVSGDNIGHLKVSFFGPFYASYVVFYLDSEQYSYSLVTGPNKEYLWILSRTPEITDELYEELKTLSQRYGFDTSSLINIDQVNSD